jgi:prevent-host-death family protein
MTLTATDAKNRFGRVLEQAQRQPVIIEKAGRRHSVVMSAEHYDRLVAVAQAGAASESVVEARHSPEAERFYAQYKDWVDMQNALVERHGIPGEEYRTW